MTQNQPSNDYVLEWLRELFAVTMHAIEMGSTVHEQMERYRGSRREFTLVDITSALRSAEAVVGYYDINCPVVRGFDAEGNAMSVVIAPPSPKNRVRVIKIWI